MQDRESNAPKHYLSEIQKTWRCELKSCRNYGYTCLIVERRHYTINVNDLRQWNTAILKVEATVLAPPLALHPQPGRIAKKRKQSRRDGYSSDPEETPRKNRFMSNFHFHVSQSHSKHANAVLISSSPSTTPPSKPDKHARPSSSSSSIDLSDTDNKSEDKLAVYLNWLAERNPEDCADYSGALQALKRERYKLKQLGSIAAGTWQAMGVPMGLGQSICSEIKEFKRSIASKGLILVFYS